MKVEVISYSCTGILGDGQNRTSAGIGITQKDPPFLVQGETIIHPIFAKRKRVEQKGHFQVVACGNARSMISLTRNRKRNRGHLTLPLDWMPYLKKGQVFHFF
jgi:hypothetical protein